MTALVEPTGAGRRPRLTEAVKPSAVSRWLDRFASAGVTHFGSLAPPYLVYGVAGLGAGILVMSALGLYKGIPLTTQVLLIVSSLAVFVATGLAQKAVLGRERYVLWENVILVLFVAAGVGAATGSPALAVLDCHVVALGVCLAVARWGCLAHGCCHGKPAAFGVRYETGLHEDDPLTGVRLFPVQLLDSAALLTVTGIAAIITTNGAAAGRALTFWLLGYGIARFFIEFARGDSRSQWGPLTEAQWTLVVLVLALFVKEQIRGNSEGVVGLVELGVSITVLLVAYLTRSRWMALSPHAPNTDQVRDWQVMLTKLDFEARRHYRAAVGTAPWEAQALTVTVVIDRLDEGEELHAYTVRAVDGALSPRAAVLAGGMLLQRLPSHRVVRVDACLHDTLAVWVIVDSRTPPGSHPGDDMKDVALRTRAAAGELLAATKLLAPVRAARGWTENLDPRLLPPA